MSDESGKPVAEDGAAAPTAASGETPPASGDSVGAAAAAAAESGGSSKENPTDPPPTAAPFREREITKPMHLGVRAEGDAARPTPEGIGLRVYGKTDVGLVREHNEDNFLLIDLGTGAKGVIDQPVPEALQRHVVGPRGTVLAVCDGMGGAAAGEVASQMAIDTVQEVMLAGNPPSDRDDFARRLVLSIEEAGGRIFGAAKLDRTRRGMGTTSTVAGLLDTTLFVGQVGDSRAYVLRGDMFKMITKDQSLVNQLIEAGQLTEEEAEAFEHSNIILQALGTAEQVTVDLTFLEVRRGDRLMLCSDGLSGLVHADLMKEVLQSTPEPEECCKRLIEMARNGGGHDNITVIVADFDGTALVDAKPEELVGYRQYPLPPAPPGQSFQLPTREVSMKSGGPKPGADVKRAGADGSAVHWEDPAQTRQGGGLRWVMIGLIGVLVLLLVGALLLIGGMTAAMSDSNEGVRAQPSVPNGLHVVPPPAPTFPVEIDFPDGMRGYRLLIDDELDPILIDGPYHRRLEAGLHHLEVRAPGGSPMGTRVVLRPFSVGAGSPPRVTVDFPAGFDRLPPPPMDGEEGAAPTAPAPPSDLPPTTPGIPAPASPNPFAPRPAAPAPAAPAPAAPAPAVPAPAAPLPTGPSGASPTPAP